MRTPLLFSIGLVLVACSEPPAPIPVVTIAETADTLVVPTVQVSHAAPLSGDRWAVLALQDNTIQIADFSAKRVIPFPGITSAEVTRPTALFGIGDTVIISDFGLRRVTRWTPALPRLEAIPVTDALRGVLPRARDAAGQWYFQVPPRNGVASSDGTLDSAVIVRSDANFTKFDTLARLAPPEMASGGQNQSFVRRALSGDDRWGIRPDGTLWIARVRYNRIDLYPVGSKKPVIGKALPDPLLMLTPMDKEIYIRRFPADQQEDVRLITQWTFVKPPFESVFPADHGRLWLFKSAPALDSVRTFQVVDSTGLRLVVAVPSRGIALGVSSDAILMGEEFPGGIRLLRYPIPAEALKP